MKEGTAWEGASMHRHFHSLVNVSHWQLIAKKHLSEVWPQMLYIKNLWPKQAFSFYSIHLVCMTVLYFSSFCHFRSSDGNDIVLIDKAHNIGLRHTKSSLMAWVVIPKERWLHVATRHEILLNKNSLNKFCINQENILKKKSIFLLHD